MCQPILPLAVPLLRPRPSISEGLRRRGFSSDSIHQLRRAFKILYRQGLTLELALQRLETMLSDAPEVQVLIDSIRASERGIVR